MKDLKYLYEFEKLLESANNPLVQQACAEGKHALAYTCYHMPEVLLNTGDCFSVRLRAPLTGSLDISSYYMSNFICDYCKSLLERGIEGGYNFLSALLATETCSEMNRALEHFELLHLVDNEQFFVTFLDIPCATMSTSSGARCSSRCMRSTAWTCRTTRCARPWPSTTRSAAS